MQVVVQSKIPAAAAGVDAKIALIVADACLMIEALAKMRAPVDTGFLRGSIQSHFAGLTGTVNVGAEYGVYVEFGTVKMAARPFMTPAVAAVRPKLATMVKRRLGGAT